MALEITGKIIKFLPQQTGSGKNGTWVKQEFIIETADQYPKKVCCAAWGDKTDALKNLKEGDTVKVSFNLESREYNERWYTDVRAWKIEAAGKGSSQAPPPAEDPGNFGTLQGESDSGEDLPF